MRHTVNLAFVGEGPYRSVYKPVPLALGEALGDVRNPAVCGELCRPDGVSCDDIRFTTSGLEFGLDLVEVLPVVRGHLADGDLEFTLVLLVEFLYELVLRFFGNALPVVEDDVALALSTATGRSPEQHRSCEPRATEPQEVPAAQRVPAELR